MFSKNCPVVKGILYALHGIMLYLHLLSIITVLFLHVPLHHCLEGCENIYGIGVGDTVCTGRNDGVDVAKIPPVGSVGWSQFNYVHTAD